MHSHVWFACLARVCLWFAVLDHSSVAVPNEFSNNFRQWKSQSKLRTDILPTTLPSKHTKSEPPMTNRLVIGLSVGLGLMVVIIVCWTWIRCRRRRTKKKPDGKEQHPEHGYIDEEEDSVPYRIVDLQTNISTDASGYTFLEAKRQDEEKPYMKLQPKCSRAHNKECTEDVDHSFEEVVDDEDEDEERPYQKLQPEYSRVHNKDCTEDADHPFEEIADEPVYFMLEAKENSTTT